MSAPTRALVALAGLGIDHVVHRFEAEGADGGYGLAAARMLGVDEERVFKTLLATVDGRAVVAVVPVSSPVNSSLSALLAMTTRAPAGTATAALTPVFSALEDVSQELLST